MSYIKIKKVYDKLKRAEELYAPVIMMAAAGYGKSAAAEYYYRRKKILILNCEVNGSFQEMPDIEKIRNSVVIIEDMQWLTDEDGIKYLKKLLLTQGLQVVMLTRGRVPRFLAREEMDQGFVRIQEGDFSLQEPEVDAFFKDRGIELSSEDLKAVTDASKGYISALHCYALRMADGEKYSEAMRKAVLGDLYNLWDGNAYEHWPDKYKWFALSLCHFESFTEEMAVYITGDTQIGSVIDYCLNAMNQLFYNEDGYYFRPEIKGFFLWKRARMWSDAEKATNCRKAANYYEMKGDTPRALKYYKEAGDIQRQKDLLIRNVQLHPGTGHYADSKEYYLSLPREEILDNPILIAGMSMLYSLLMQPEKSEEWYRELEKYSKNKDIQKEYRKEAKCRLAYLDIALPHRGIIGILGIMKNAFTMIGNGEVELPEFAATGNMPSIMNGGLDFCEWSKNDTQIARFMAKPIEVILGRYGKGIVTVALAESGFEKGTMSAYEVMTRCGDAYSAATHANCIEICFVAVGVQVRQHLAEGQLPSAKRLTETYAEKVNLEKAEHMVPTLNTFITWLAIYEGNKEAIHDHIEKTPDPRVSFYITDRFRQMVKIRCLIAENRLEEALDTATFMTTYYKTYDRIFYWIENEVLKSIILYRMGDEHYKEILINALKKAEEYHFVRVISLNGPMVLPVLLSVKEEGMTADLDTEYIRQVTEETIKVATFYPNYSKTVEKENISLSRRESQVLSMLCAGMTTEEICNTLGISYDGLKKHNKNIYKKLGVKDRAEAERKAGQLGLVYRGGMNNEMEA